MDLVGKNISHFSIISKLGEGGMGVVYKAEDTRLGRMVALKFLPLDLTRHSEAKERFTQEAKAASSLQHDNICAIHDIDETPDGQMFIVMDYYEGKTLKDTLSGGPLPISDVIDYTAHIASGLKESHKKGIVHRDIKPANIMITQRGQVKIMDFGLAKLAGQAHVTRTSSTLGTASHMSPEQAHGENVDHRTDIWSLGVVLYEMLTGQLPFKGDYEQAVIYSILNEEPKSPSALRQDVPKLLEWVTLKALAKKQEERYQSIDELLADLNEGKTERLPTAPKRKSRLPVYLVAGAVVLALLGGTVALFMHQKSGEVKKRKSIAILPFHPITKSEEDISFAEGIHDDILTQVSKISDLRVIARTSVMRYQESQKSIEEIAHELGVGTVLEGSTRRIGNTVRVVAQLIAADTEDYLWAETYDRSYTDIFAIQSDVAQKIAEALKARLVQEELHSIQTQPTQNLEAYEYYKKGINSWRNAFTKEDNLTAANMFKKACQLDTGFALAYAWQSISYSSAYAYTPASVDAPATNLKSEETLAKAALLAPDMPEVHLARAYYLNLIKGEIDPAIKEIEMARRKRQNNPEILQFMALLVRSKGDFENALILDEKVYRLDPKGAEPVYASGNAFLIGRFADAVRWCDIFIANFPDDVTGYLGKIEFSMTGLGDIAGAETSLNAAKNFVTKGKSSLVWPEYLVHYYKRDYSRAFATLLRSEDEKYFLLRARLLKLMNRPQEAKVLFDSARIAFSQILNSTPDNGSARLSLATAYAGLGQKEKALQELALVDSAARRMQGLNIAALYILNGDNDSALLALERCIDVPSEATAFQLRLDPFLDSLKSDPRFKKLIERAENRYKKK